MQKSTPGFGLLCMDQPKTLDVNVSVKKINLVARIRGQIITALLQGEQQQITCLLADLAQIESSDTIPEKYNSHGAVQDGWDCADDHVHAFSDILLEFLQRPSLPNISVLYCPSA